MLKDKIDDGLFERFETGLDPLNPHLSKISAKIIGYGEMSTISLSTFPVRNILLTSACRFQSTD